MTHEDHRSSAAAAAVAVGRRVLTTEADALTRLADALDRSFGQAVALLARIDGRVVVCGIAKSGHVARPTTCVLAVDSLDDLRAPVGVIHMHDALRGGIR